jgi:predicted regulator of Ras-like GTPase activity (Roadblock/LC7/MglB family)
MCALRPAVSANFSAALVAAIASGVIGLAMMFSKLFNHVFSRELGVVAGAA